MAQLIPEAGRLSGKELSAVGSDKRMLQFSRTVLLSQQGLWSGADVDFGTCPQPPCAPQWHPQNLAQHFLRSSCLSIDPLSFFSLQHSGMSFTAHQTRAYLGAFSQLLPRGWSSAPSAPRYLVNPYVWNWKNTGCVPGKRKDGLPAPLHHGLGSLLAKSHFSS